VAQKLFNLWVFFRKNPKYTFIKTENRMTMRHSKNANENL